MSSAMLEQVAIMAFDLDHSEVQDKLVSIHGRVMTVAELREALVPKTRKVRQGAVGMKHLYDAVQAGDAAKTREVYDRLLPTMGKPEIIDRLAFHMLLNTFKSLVGDL